MPGIFQFIYKSGDNFVINSSITNLILQSGAIVTRGYPSQTHFSSLSNGLLAVLPAIFLPIPQVIALDWLVRG